ncbi:glycosyltransferase family 2 protein [Miltoncostaea oceani]|uniref:glycosyltransferase family 2 protein n=1 Tax=Miltoncostaea oceani TaxID=2843216 RepID=UPI001FE5E5B0|nr:glycosyltransferase family 2 protein [Miltoncostaea oceani]
MSVVIPVLNEEHTIVPLLRALRRQTYPVGLIEVVIADGGSLDATREMIQGYASRHPELAIRLEENPSGSVPAGLNVAVARSSGEIVVRLDGHSEPFPDYIERCVAALAAGLGDNVGGRWKVLPSREGAVSAAIAFAAVHTLGAGDARYRTGGEAGPVDTVPFGAYRRSTFEAVGPYDETLLANEDYEWNVRLRASGGCVWFDGDIQCVYRPRETYRALGRQYFRYGFWKFRMLLGAPESMRLRQAAPPAALMLAATLGVASRRRPLARVALGTLAGAYTAALGRAGLAASQGTGDRQLTAGVPVALATMHLSWATGFLSSGLLETVRRMPRPSER